jgi:hypothetical protein
MHPLAIYFLIFPLTAQADLFKCTDNAGKVTYTNSSCTKVGLKEAKIIPPPPPPALDKPVKAAESAKPVIEKSADNNAKSRDSVALKLVKPAQGSQDKCAKLNGDMGRIMDQMDTVHRGGQSPDEEAGWNEVLKKLQAEKNRLGCF